MSTPTRDLRPLPERVQARLRDRPGTPPDENVVLLDWLPPAEAGFDEHCPELPELRAELVAARSRAENAALALAEAEAGFDDIEAVRREAARAGEPLPDYGEAERALRDASVLHDGALDHLADVAASIALRVAEHLPGWQGTVGQLHTEREELRRQAQEALARAERLLIQASAFEDWARRIEGHGTPGTWMLPFDALTETAAWHLENEDRLNPRASALAAEQLGATPTFTLEEDAR